MRPQLAIMAAAAVAIAATVTPAAAAATESFRLAYSKAGNIEIFVDHAQRDDWCASTLTLRAVHGSEANRKALADLFPKLGALIDRQCPQATRIEWTSTTADGKPVARGTSAKADRWIMRTAPAMIASAPAAAPPAAPAPSARTAPPAAPAPSAAATPPNDPAPAARAAASTATAPAAPAAPPAQPASTPSAAAVAAAPAAAVPAAALPAAKAAEAAASAATPATSAIGDFEINGWRPLDAAKARAQADFLKEFQDQNGCRILTSIDRTDLPSLTLKSEDLQCGTDGYASGKGRLALDRSDGVRVGRTGTLWFADGVPMRHELGHAPLAGSAADRTLWFFLGSDAASRSHFMLRAQYSTQSGIGVWVPAAQIDAITGDEAQFRQAGPIQAAVDAALAAFDRNGMPGARWVKLVFANDFASIADPQRAGDHLVYQIQPERRRARRGTEGPGEWQVNLQRATNHLFQRDARAAQQKAMEERRAAQLRLIEEQRQAQRQRAEAFQKASVERRKLQTYQSFTAAAGDPKRLLSRLESDLAYTPGTGGSYVRVLDGARQRISRIVHVDGHDDDDAKVDFPYEMRLVGQRELKAGWYLVRGAVALDGKRRDAQDLPLTLVTIGDKAPYACRKDGCADLLDPLALTRLELGEPDWTPEAAAAVIESAGRP